MENNNQPQWYVLQSQFGYESIAKASLLQMIEINKMQDLILDVVVPEEEEIVERNGKRQVVLRKKFPNYIFIKMIYTKHSWYMVKQTRGVKDFCSGYDGKPLPMSPEEVRRARLENVKAEDLNVKIGDNVKIISGALSDFIGEVKEIKIDQQKIKVAVNMFGREASVELEFNQIEKIS